MEKTLLMFISLLNYGRVVHDTTSVLFGREHEVTIDSRIIITIRSVTVFPF